MSLITEAIKQELISLYSAPDRFYHDMSHVNALLTLLEEHHNSFADPHAVEAAIWFHDSIYDTHTKDNEHQSAELAITRLKPTCTTASDEKRLRCIHDMIEATASHVVAPQSSDPDELSDTLLFLDMDLSILGSDPARFDEYEAAVRKEYAWVSDEAWCKGRAAVLERFQARPRIFSSELFRGLYEGRARENIARSLERLRVQGSQAAGVAKS